jgi:hypothetical protein
VCELVGVRGSLYPPIAPIMNLVWHRLRRMSVEFSALSSLGSEPASCGSGRPRHGVLPRRPARQSRVHPCPCRAAPGGSSG